MHYNDSEMSNNNFIKLFKEVGISNVGEVGGKNASLGEMIKHLSSKGVNIPGGFIITAGAYRFFLAQTGLDEFIIKTLSGLDAKNLKELSRRAEAVRHEIEKTQFPENLAQEIIKAYENIEKQYRKDTDVAVRSSATAEDLPGASFAGEHETYLNIRGAQEVLTAARKAMASLFTERAISYRIDKGFDHFKVALSVGVQKMVRSDKACSGVMFTIDTESGFKNVILINGSWGLGEMIVQGEVTPDEFLVFKPFVDNARFNPIIDKKLGNKNRKMVYRGASGKSGGIKNTKIIPASRKEKSSFVLSEKEILKLARWGKIIENHYSQKYKKWTPMDMEWAKDGETGELFIVQARPETIHANRDFSKLKEYVLESRGKAITKGISVGNKIAAGKARVILDAKNISQFRAGEILITDMTDPDWEPIMKIASAIVTDKGGRTSHAAIVSRELGIPCVVGTENATRIIKNGQDITVDASGTEGIIFEGKLKFFAKETDVKNLPKTKTKIMLNIATPDTAFEKSFLPNSGVGLAREEFIIAGSIGIHPNALINYKKLPRKIKNIIDRKTAGYEDKTRFYVDKLAYGIAKIVAAFYPNPVILRFSDFKTNEYKTLIGGELYEPQEENPMIGWRGASRYYHADFKEAFVLELKAIKKVREEMGLNNLEVMVPFCRTPEEGRKILKIIADNGFRRRNNMRIHVMCEIPSNVLRADEFLDIFDGMSIGSNDLTQLTLGIDRDGNEKIRGIANENDESVRKLIAEIIKKCRARKKYIGVCGQAPSDYPEFAEFLAEQRIESISLNPDTIIKTIFSIYQKEKILSKYR